MQERKRRNKRADIISEPVNYPPSFKNIIERDLYGKIYSKAETTFPVYGYDQYKYKCIHNNQIYDLVIYYLNYAQKIETQFVKENMEQKLKEQPISKSPVDTTGPLYKKTIVMTGFRDDILGKMIEKAGGKLGSSVSKNTFTVIVKDNSSENQTGKVEQAKKLGVVVMDVKKFKDLYFVNS